MATAAPREPSLALKPGAAVSRELGFPHESVLETWNRIHLRICALSACTAPALGDRRPGLCYSWVTAGFSQPACSQFKVNAETRKALGSKILRRLSGS